MLLRIEIFKEKIKKTAIPYNLVSLLFVNFEESNVLIRMYGSKVSGNIIAVDT